jgi:hypothetical protein
MTIQELSNYELEYLFRIAQEEQDGRKIKAINNERNRRSREE